MKTDQVKRVLRSTREIGKMRRAGLVVWQAHQAAARLLKPGVTTAELNDVYRLTFQQFGAVSLFAGYGPPESPFPAEACTSINEEIVHGIPGNRTVREGDLVKLDTGCSIDNWCGDAAVTHAVGRISERQRQLVQITHQTLDLAIELMSTKRWWSEIAREMQTLVQDHGFSVVKELTGHGIGQKLHEPPQVPNYWSSEFGPNDDFDLRPGLVFACEPMVNEGTEAIEYLQDKWTAVTADGKCSAHVEHTIAITGEGPVRLTAPPAPHELELVSAEFRDENQWFRW